MPLSSDENFQQTFAVTMPRGAQGLDTGQVKLAVMRALQSLGVAPVGLQVSEVDPSAVPKVLLTVEDGRADIAAVEGTVLIVHADLDREGETVTEEQIDDILAGGVYTGNSGDYGQAIGEAREGLARYLPNLTDTACR